MKALMLLLLLIPFSVSAQQEVEKIFNDKTRIENPLDLRDPFRPPTSLGRGKKESTAGELRQMSPEEMLQGISVSDIIVSGVLIGKERRAVIRNRQNDKEYPIIVKEGYKIGPERIEVKAILPGGVILVEKMINVYGQEEYLETVIPITREIKSDGVDNINNYHDDNVNIGDNTGGN